MKWFVTALAPLLLIWSNSFYISVPQSRGRSAVNEAQQPGKSEPAVPTIEFREFFEANTSELKPSAKLLGLNGRRARLVGFMAQMERPLQGAFYLCPRPVYSDESGGGTAELPIGSVRVIVRTAKGKSIPFVSRPIEVVGILEVGNQTEDDGTVSAIRLILDPPKEPVNSVNPSPSSTKRGVKPKASLKNPRRK